MPAALLDAIAPLSARRRAPSAIPKPWYAAFGLALTCIIGIAVVSFVAVDDARDAAERVDETQQVIERTQVLFSGLKDAESGQRGFLLTGNESYLEAYMAARAAQASREAKLREATLVHPSQLERAEMLARLAAEKYAEMQRTIELRRSGQTEQALAMLRSDQGKTTMDRIRQVVAALEQEARGRLEQRRATWRETSASALNITLAGAAVLLLLTLGVTGMAVREHRHREDELWIRRTQNLLGNGLQGDVDEATLAGKALNVLVHALQAHGGTLHARRSDGRLALLGAVGVQRDGLPESLPPGEGWTGQVAAQARPMHLTGVPASHLRIATSTGASAPAEVYLAPVAHEGQVQGVLEVAFFDTMGPVAKALVDRVALLLGSALHGADRRTRLQQLLEETQRQSEELQAQQEELRVSNEELEERGRVLRESQARLEVQQTELERVNGQITQYARRLEQQQVDLKANAAALESASRYKSEFLANMSHELRTPLNSSLILSRLLLDNKTGTLTDEQVRYARAIHDANNDLLALINDILDLSKIEAGHAELHPEPVLPADLARRLRVQFEPQALAKGLGFDVDADPAAPPQITTDGQRLAQVLKNLLANAIKFTPQGRVVLALRPGAAGGVRFEVSDTGIGIAADKQELIFEAFRQADGSTSRQFGGTGLGLSISRELVHRMGGRIEVQSRPGQGSTFAVELPPQLPAGRADAADATQAPVQDRPPATAPATTPEPAAPPAPVPLPARTARGTGQRRVLLAVEDDHAFASVLQTLVEEAGFDCVIARDGAQALELARQHMPAGVLLDVGLPDVSGLSVLERLKREPSTRHIPVHIVSAGERSQPALQMGAIGHLVKPAPREQLVEAIERLRLQAEHGPRRLLIVEDDATLRQSLQALLQGPDVRIDTVGTLADARQALQRSTYDCMVTDLSLPDGSGFELLERMAADPDSAFPPVIVYTGRALDRDEETRLRRVSRSIIVKGARSPERLLDEVTLFLHSVESQLPGEQQRLLRVARERDAVMDGRRILLAEDDVRNIFALSSVFEPLGVKLEVARNGREALDRLSREADIDLVLMDIMMPEMDGLTAMRRIRERAEWQHLPIIALTAKAMADDRQQCLAAGANDYLSKPIDVDRLVSLCRVWMPK